MERFSHLAEPLSSHTHLNVENNSYGNQIISLKYYLEVAVILEWVT